MPVNIEQLPGILDAGNTAKGPVDLIITLRCSDAEDVRGLERAIPVTVGAASVRGCEKFGVKVISASAQWSQHQPLISAVTSQKK